MFHLKANLHWGVARSSRARFFVCFIESGNPALVHGSARQLLGAIKETKNRARLLLATPQCILAFRDWQTSYKHYPKIGSSNTKIHMSECKLISPRTLSRRIVPWHTKRHWGKINCLVLLKGKLGQKRLRTTGLDRLYQHPGFAENFRN